MPKILEKCVKDVTRKNQGKKKKVNPWAVCSAATGWVKKKGGGWIKKKKTKK